MILGAMLAFGTSMAAPRIRGGDPIGSFLSQYLANCPHIRGDDSMDDLVNTILTFCSPHARG